MKAETVLKLNGGDIAAAEERCAEWIKAYSAVAEEHPSAEEKAAKLIARAKNALDVIKTREDAGADPLFCKDEAYMEQVGISARQRIRCFVCKPVFHYRKSCKDSTRVF